MADMSGLFGPSPYEIEQQRLAQANQNAVDYSRMNATQRGVMGLYQAGGMFGNMGAKAFGGADPAVQNAQASYEAMKSIDTSTPEGLMQYAAKIKEYDPNKATQAVMMARKMQAEAATQRLAQQKEDRAQRELEEVKIAGVVNKMQMEKDRLAANIAKWAADANNVNLSIEQRREAVNAINETKIQIAEMDNAARLKGFELKKSHGSTADGRINLSTMKDADKWRIVKEQAADKAAIGNAGAQTKDVTTLATQLLSHKGLSNITGWNALTNAAALPGSDAKGALTLLESLKAKASTVGRALASQSGKLGNMALGEWKIVSDDIANLDPKSPEFVDQVKRIVAKTEAMEQRLRETYDEKYSIYEGLNPALSADNLPPQAPRFDQSAPQPTPRPMVAPVQQPAPGKSFSGVTTPAQVKQLYQKGTITREQAKAILAEMDAQGVK